MNIMVGDNRLEGIANKLSDVKVRDAYVVANEQAKVALDEQAKKKASDGVVLELSKSGLDASNTEQAKAEKVQQMKAVLEKQQAQQTQQQNAEINKQDVAVATQRVLENINI